jgi:hypothetical protein
MKYTIAIIMIFLSILLVLVTFVYPSKEGFSLSPGIYPKYDDEVILDDYSKIGKNETSNKNYKDIWWKYPVLPLSRYEQITNNIRYNKNPDNGTCIRADFCDALYYDKKDIKSNIIKQLPPAEEGSGSRVGYFRSDANKLYFSIPTNENILY